MDKIIEMAVEEIIPYENNPRKNDKAVDKVAASISQFGFRQPIIIDKNNIIICGHTRLKAAERLGLRKIPVIRAEELTDDQVKAYRLADNKVSEFSEWDFDALADELAQLEGVDMSNFGFDEMETKFDEAIDLDDEGSEKNEDEQICHCPKCGFEFKI